MGKLSKTVLIIEDEEAIFIPLRAMLEERGFTVIIAKDGVEGLEKVQTARPDLVLLDILLPKIDGFKVLQEIKTNSGTKYIPVIILSNLGGEEDMQRGLDLGAKEYFVKSRVVLATIGDYIVSHFGS